MNNNFMIEGVDNNNKAVTGPLVYVPTEATAEFTLLQNQFSAEFGHSTGGQFNTVIKSGTNQIHGSPVRVLPEPQPERRGSQFVHSGFPQQSALRPEPLGASRRRPYHQGQAVLFRQLSSMPRWAWRSRLTPVSAPTAAGFAMLDKMSGISKTNYSHLQAVCAAGPGCKRLTTVNGVKIPIGDAADLRLVLHQFLHAALGSIDYNMSRATTRFAAASSTTSSDSLDNNANLPAFWTTLPQRFYLASVAEYHTFSPNLTNELRLASTASASSTPFRTATFPGWMCSRISHSTIDLGLQIGPDSNAPQYTIQNTYQLVDNINWTKGKHTLKFGFDGRNSISPQHFIQRDARRLLTTPRWSSILTDQFRRSCRAQSGQHQLLRQPVGHLSLCQRQLAAANEPDAESRAALGAHHGSYRHASTEPKLASRMLPA